MHLAADKESWFPNLRRENYRVTSAATAVYNCIAYAAGRDDSWYWPPVEGVAEGCAWPSGIPVAEKLEAFEAVYAALGYEPCDGPGMDAGYEKVAIYVDRSGVPTHAARQLDSGRWTSKVGEWEDIEHAELEDLEDPNNCGLGYGRVAKVMRRKRAGGT